MSGTDITKHRHCELSLSLALTHWPVLQYVLNVRANMFCGGLLENLDEDGLPRVPTT
eukprot:m.74346 g.74346  ORF g.74346 m.74346 type:complete len:57 (-) comp14425_c0_seq1:311-481(-)